MVFRFKLKKTRLEDGSITFHPHIQVTLLSGGKSKDVSGVLDTGSDLVYIPFDMAEYFGLKLSEYSKIARSPEGEFEYFSSNLSIGMRKGHDFFRDSFEVVVSKTQKYPEVILGVPFLSRFVVTFDYANEKILLKKAIKRERY